MILAYLFPSVTLFAHATHLLLYLKKNGHLGHAEIIISAPLPQ